MAGITVTLSTRRDRMVEPRIDERRIRNYIANRLNDARNTFIRHMNDGRPRRSEPGEYPRTDSGRLSTSVDFEVGEREGRLYTDVEYAIFLATGTRRMASRRMLADALEEVMAERPGAEELARAFMVR